MNALIRKSCFMVILAFVLVCITAGVVQVCAENPLTGILPGSEAETLPEDLTYENVDDFLALLDDSRVRRILLGLLLEEVERRQLESQVVSGSESSFEEKIAALAPRLRFMLSGFAALPQDLSLVLQNIAVRRGAGHFFPLYLWILIVVFFGGLIEWFVRRKNSSRVRAIREP